MKLFFSPTSPFVRKVMVVAHELGIADRIELQRVPVSPHLPNPALAAFNPLMKLPTLLTDSGEALFGSQLICEFLDHAQGGTLFPQSATMRWRVGRLHALADGMLEAGIACREDLHRFGTMDADAWVGGRKTKISQGVDYLESVADELGSRSILRRSPWLSLFPGFVFAGSSMIWPRPRRSWRRGTGSSPLAPPCSERSPLTTASAGRPANRSVPRPR